MSRIEYHQLLGFEHIYLEDSYVLDIPTQETAVEFQLLAVLIETNPLYETPLSDQPIIEL